MSKRQQEGKLADELRVVAKSKPMMSLVLKIANRSPTVNSTPHRALINTRKLFSRVAQAHIAVFFVCVISKTFIVSRACHVSHVA